MAAPAHRYQQLAPARELDYARDVGGVRAACNECWMLVDHPIPDTPCHGIPFLIRSEQRPVHSGAQVLHSGGLDRGLSVRRHDAMAQRVPVPKPWHS